MHCRFCLLIGIPQKGTHLAAAEAGLEDVQGRDPDTEGDLSAGLSEVLGDGPAEALQSGRDAQGIPVSVALRAAIMLLPPARLDSPLPSYSPGRRQLQQ